MSSVLPRRRCTSPVLMAHWQYLCPPGPGGVFESPCRAPQFTSLKPDGKALVHPCRKLTIWTAVNVLMVVALISVTAISMVTTEASDH